jgi:hypothetical protein
VELFGERREELVSIVAINSKITEECCVGAQSVATHCCPANHEFQDFSFQGIMLVHVQHSPLSPLKAIVGQETDAAAT